MVADENPFALRRDAFEEWFRTPVGSTSPDPRIEVRRAHPSEFDRIYDVVDAAFGFKRPRALNDWAYRQNPYGPARCWVIVERATAEVIGALCYWPWPLARGSRPLQCEQGGDLALLPKYRNQGVFRVAAQILDGDPWKNLSIVYGWPNQTSVKRLRQGWMGLTGVLPKRVLPLRSDDNLARRGVPRPAAAVAGRLLDGLFRSWFTLRLKRRFDAEVEQIRSFDSAFDDLTRRCMSWEGYWSPHDAEFLNWRYLRDPTREHLALALTVGSRLSGYSVIRIHRGGHFSWSSPCPRSSRMPRVLCCFTRSKPRRQPVARTCQLPCRPDGDTGRCCARLAS